MFRKITVAIALLFATGLSAETRQRAVGSTPTDAALAPITVPGTTVSGVVSSVSGNLIQLAGGLVTIDASQAKISDERGTAGTVASITPGSIVFAILSTANVAPNAPLPATLIGVTRVNEVTLGGPVQAVTTNSITVLGRTIGVTNDTSFGGRARTLADVLVNDIALVQAKVVSGALVATSVLVYAPLPRPSTVIHGTVKSIGTDSWVITDRAGKDWTIVVNGQTKITGDPKVNDTVDVLVNTDNANQYIAVSIIKSVTVQPFVVFSGEVKSIGATSWVIRDARANKDVTVAVNAKTKISGDPKVNDGVIVTADVDAAGNYIATTIVKLGIVPPSVELRLRGVVKSIGATSWTIGPEVGLGVDFNITVNADTKIVGNPAVRDRVEVIVSVTLSGYVAKSITKL